MPYWIHFRAGAVKMAPRHRSARGSAEAATVEDESRFRVETVGDGRILPGDHPLIGTSEFLSQPEASGVNSSTAGAYRALSD